MYTGFVLLILNGGIYVLNYPNVFETRPYQWYVILVLVNFLIWHLVDQNFASKHQMLSRVSMMMAKSRDGNVSRKTSSRGKKTPRSKKKNRKNNVEIAPLPRGAFETSVESDSSIVGECDAKLFKIRSKKYKKTRKKVSCLKISRIVSHTHTYTHNKYQVHSTNDMYEFMTMHSFRSSDRSFNNIVETGSMNLPQPSKKFKTRQGLWCTLLSCYLSERTSGRYQCVVQQKTRQGRTFRFCLAYPRILS